jgi:hypothetical protein
MATEKTEYRIETLADIFTVPADKHDALLADLAAWLKYRADMLDALRKVGVGDLVEMPPVMTWVDDGVTGLSSLCVTITRGEGEAA